MHAAIAVMVTAQYFSTVSADETSLERKDRHAHAEIARLEHALAKTTLEADRRRIERDLAEVQSALENNHRPSVPRYVDFIEFPILMVDALYNPVGKGKTPATNLQGASSADLSRVDPVNSTYWNRPRSIVGADLDTGFDRAALPNYDVLWNYGGPKKSGRNAGCVLASGDLRVKVKFAETHSEPFTARIFHALGYNVDPTDFSPALKMKYDRRFLEEFNSRRPMTMRAGMFFVPLFRFNLQNAYDPFAFIDHAVLKSGATISGDALKTKLLRHPKRKHAEQFPQAFNEEVEEQIDYLVTKPTNVQIETPHTHNIGPWAFGGHDHENLRELRGAAVLAAWLGWWDSRCENTRLRVVKTADGAVLKHFWTDLGGGLGRAAGTFRHSCENPNDFGWSFTRTTIAGRESRFEIKDYEPVENTPAFAAMTIDDARWMARLIAQLTETQIVDALRASGFIASEVHVYTEKLMSRRDNLLRDLNLTTEFALLRPDGRRHDQREPARQSAPPRDYFPNRDEGQLRKLMVITPFDLKLSRT
jgi:hypothetical protein